MVFRLVTIIMMIMISVSGCGMLPEEEGTLVPPIITPEEIPFRTIVLEKQDIEDAVTVRGAVAPALMENYFFDEKGGRIKRYNVRVGDIVQQGDVLIELVVDQLADTIDYQKMTVNNLVVDRDTTVALQKLTLRKAEMTLGQLEEDYATMVANSSLYTANAIDEAKDVLDQTQLDYEILNLTQAQSLDLKKRTLEIEQLRLDHYEATLEASYIRASMPGVVTYIRRGFIGDTVTDFETLISVADITKIQVDYQGSMAHRFELGMPVELVYRGQNYTGQVILTPDSVPLEDRPNYLNSAIFAIDTVPDNYIMGDDVAISALLDSRKNVIVLPKDAVKTLGTDKIVYVLEAGEKRERYITLGIESGPYVEVVQGLSVGDEVIIN